MDKYVYLVSDGWGCTYGIFDDPDCAVNYGKEIWMEDKEYDDAQWKNETNEDELRLKNNNPELFVYSRVVVYSYPLNYKNHHFSAVHETLWDSGVILVE